MKDNCLKISFQKIISYLQLPKTKKFFDWAKKQSKLIKIQSNRVSENIKERRKIYAARKLDKLLSYSQ